MENFAEVSRHPRLIQLDSLIEQEAQLSEALAAGNFADSSIQEQYENAHAAIQSQMQNTVAIDRSAIDELERIRDKAEAAKNQLEELAEITGQSPDRELLDEYISRIVMVGVVLGPKTTEEDVATSEADTEELPTAETVTEVEQPEQEEALEIATHPEESAERQQETALSLRDMTFVATKLVDPKIRHAMRDLNVPRLSKELQKELFVMAQNSGVTGASASSREEMYTARRGAWSRLEALLGDEDQLCAAIDEAEAGSLEEQFLNYLTSIDETAKEFVPKLLTASQEVTIDNMTVLRAEDDAVLWRQIDSPSDYIEEDEEPTFSELTAKFADGEEVKALEPEVEVEQPHTEAALPTEPETEEGATSAQTESETETEEVEPLATVTSLDDERQKKTLKEKVREKKDEVLEGIKAELESFTKYLCEELGLDDKAVLGRRQVLNVFSMNDSALDKLISSGKLSVKEGDKQPKFNIQDLITIKAHFLTKNSKYTILERKGRGAKMVHTFVDELASNFVARRVNARLQQDR